MKQSVIVMSLAALLAFACGGPSTKEAAAPSEEEALPSEAEARLATYTSVRLTSDLSSLTENQKKMVALFIEAAEAMDGAFWQQAYGDGEALLASIEDPAVRRYAEINYGPWDRLEGNEPFVEGVGAKPEGANLYPVDMTKEELETAAEADPALGEALRGLYTVVGRDESGALTTTPYSEAYQAAYEVAAGKIREAAELAEEPGLKRYLELRAEALLSDEYFESDMAWMEMKDNALDLVIGPIETYEDKLYGYKASNEAYVLIKDLEWSERLARFAAFLPELQTGLPVPDEYKTETPGTDSDLNAYDVVYYAGDCNAGSKTIAINLPNDEKVQLEKGTRRLQLKNAMKAKFDEILMPIAGVLIVPEQQAHVTFDAFFSNTMFHEVAHGLGIKNTLDGSGTVRTALQEKSSSMEEGKADVLGLYMVTKLHEKGEMGDADLMDNYVTFLGSIFRSIRFGAASAHGVANAVRFNFFREHEAFSRNAEGRYQVDAEKMQAAMNALSEKILLFQGDGDYEGVAAFLDTYGKIGPELQADLDRLAAAGISVDIIFEQGADVLGL